MGSRPCGLRLAFAGAALAFGPALLVGVPEAHAAGAGVPVPDARFEPLCTPTDPALEELSGLAVVSGAIHGIGDSGSDEAVVVLDDTCAVTDTVPVPVDPYDVEDLGAGPDGRLWLADTGDNERARATIALIDLDPRSGAGRLHRLTYPDGPHDAETLLVQRDGVPLIVTKEVLAADGIYRPSGGAAVGDLASPGPTALERVGEIRLGPTGTPGGPVPVGASTLVTSGAVSADGTVAALRTYTDVYLYSAPDGDLVRALTTTTPARVALPGEPQGEALAFTADGALLAGSEFAGGPPPPLQILPGATDLARAHSRPGEAVPPSTAATDSTAAGESAGGTRADGETPTDGAARWSTPALVGGAVAAGLATYGLVRRRARSQRR